MHFIHLLFAGVLAGAAVGRTAPSSNVPHERRDAPLKRWAKLHRVKRDSILPVRIGLKQSNLDNGVGEAMLHEVSHHESPRYSQWYSPEEIIDFFAPAKEAFDDVRAWLEKSGIHPDRISQSANKQWVQFDAKAHEAERLFNTKYHVYEHQGTGNINVACDEYHVPSTIKHHVDYITPGLKLLAGGKVSGANPRFGPKLTIPTSELSSAGTSICDTAITPQCIATMYNITKATKASPSNRLGIFEEGDYYAAEDLVEFFLAFAPNIPITTRPILEGVDGGTAPGLYAGGESDLDFQISYPIIYPQNSILYQVDDAFYAAGLEGGGGFLNTFLDAIDGSYCTYSAFGETGNSPIDPVYPNPNPLGYQGKLQCGVYKPTNVISISYGEQEDDLPTNYQQRQCNEFMKLGMQGVSVLVASGDSGVAARGTDDGNADGCLGKGQIFNPDFPASCPYLTAVGATYLPPGASANGDQEVAVTRFPSGGGFSNIYDQPSYQASSVQSYFANHNPPYPYYSSTNNNSFGANGGIYNRNGRGYPDVAAIGDNVVVIVNAVPELIGGTSASAPTFAAILNRINEERIAIGKKSVGFVNPTLYANPQVLHDITVGNNSGCGTAGFYAATGWDPVTGLGTPNYPAMLKLFMSLP
ncbi:putative alkaline serine protease AorO [Myriangium duriaei CBS 260.36]|uniref:tripeptidyl-peptidase II n=1 Tax=Myriangium duriaei CBS 260.36 TaxID=1168546 RepID=A0A9P4IYD3_9PEZI|nr:putative alkaline serine protease AorO [Myriangium duriaei CBS 260.36]